MTGKTEDLLGGGFELISNHKSCCNLLMKMKPDEYIHWHLVFVYLPGLIGTGRYIA